MNNFNLFAILAKDFPLSSIVSLGGSLFCAHNRHYSKVFRKNSK